MKPCCFGMFELCEFNCAVLAAHPVELISLTCLPSIYTAVVALLSTSVLLLMSVLPFVHYICVF